ncbi:MAG TPA: tetratricopeptide repeat protein [Kofleriaceae bacterium]|nr:tetratricopeptide repeat protein [Kofleriaceae bacterium]
MLRALTLVVSAAALGGCGGGVSKAPMGKADKGNAADATGRVAVAVTDGPTTPLIVDWQPEQRTDLEAAIREGVVVVRLDQKGLKILPGCKLQHGDYGYVGVVTKKEVIQLKTAQQVAANLPLTGGVLGAQIGGELSRGATLDIKLAIVGRHATTWTEVTTADLAKGRACKGATHFVRGLTVGAFSMKMSAEEKAKADVKVLGAGGGSQHDASSAVDSSDGRIEDCESADPDAAKPPGQCRALVRIQLEPIVEATAEDETPDKKPDPDVTPDVSQGCAEGLVFVDGKCAEPRADAPHTCKPDDLADCDAQCNRGDAGSCEILAAIIDKSLEGGDPVAIAPPPAMEEPHAASAPAAEAAAEDAAAVEPGGGEGIGMGKIGTIGHGAGSGSGTGYGAGAGAASPGMQPGQGNAPAPQVIAALEKSCKLGSASGCANLGRQLLATGKVKRAMELLDGSCREGEALACNSAADSYWHGVKGVRKDIPRALKLFERACNGGDAIGCTNAAVLYSGAAGVKKDDARALALSVRACAGGVAVACGNAGVRHELGMGVKEDVAQAASFFERACRKDASTCMRMAILAQTGHGVAKDEKRAKELFGKSCRAGGSLRMVSCWADKALFGGAGGPAPSGQDLQRFDTLMRKQCDDGGSARACAFMGVWALESGKAAAAQASFAKGCKMKDPWACDVMKRLAK